MYRLVQGERYKVGESDSQKVIKDWVPFAEAAMDYHFGRISRCEFGERVTQEVALSLAGGAVVNGAAKCVGRVAKVVAGKVVGKMGGGKLPTFTQSEMVTKTVSKNQQKSLNIGSSEVGVPKVAVKQEKSSAKVVANRNTEVQKTKIETSSQIANDVFQKNVQRNILDGERHFLTGRRRITTGPGKTEPLLRRGEQPSARPTPKQSEIDDTLRLRKAGQQVEPQVSFLNGKRCKWGTPGSIRVDNLVDGRIAHEMKNYDLANNVNGLIRDVAEQAVNHQQHLPKGTRQIFQVDARGQVVTPQMKSRILEGVVSKSQGILTKKDIIFLEK